MRCVERLNGFENTVMPKVAIIAALEREVLPMIKKWRVTEREYDGRKFKFFENDGAVLVCSGIGAEAARRACEAVIALYQPRLVVSAGFAGALTTDFRVGDVFVPRKILDASHGSMLETGMGSGSLITFPGVAGTAQKKKLAEAYGAQAVDMEAAAVARGALARGVRFVALKGISDALDFEFSPMSQFVAPDGHFRTRKFLFFVLLRPWLWTRLIALAHNSALATKAICTSLEQFNHPSAEMVARMSESPAAETYLSPVERR